MSKNLVCDILAYLDYLKGLGLSVSIHDNGCRLPLFTEDLFPYVIHSNPYCMLVKSQKRALDQCLSCQKRVLRKCQKGAFRGMCFAGVEELVFPVGDENPLGFVCVSGYRVQRKKHRSGFVWQPQLMVLMRRLYYSRTMTG